MSPYFTLPYLTVSVSSPNERRRPRLTKGTAAALAFACGAVLALPLVLESGPAHASSQGGSTAEFESPFPDPLAMSTADAARDQLGAVRSALGADADISISVEAIDPDVASVRMFNGRPLRAARTVTMTVTAYSPDERSCGAHADGITASGYSVMTNGGRLVAADTSLLPFGSLVSVPGYDADTVVPVLDRGGAIKGHRLDVLFETHAQARQWGVRTLEVTVWEYADGKPNGFRERHWKRPTARLASRS